jgi:hypothetical protein
MANMSNYLEGEIIKYWFQNDATAAAKPATVYVALYTVIPTDASGSGTEVTGGSYARVAVTNNSTNWAGPTANNGTVLNGSPITFPAPTANWGTVVAMAIYDAATVGNELFWGSLASPQIILNGDPSPSFAAGATSIQLDN